MIDSNVLQPQTRLLQHVPRWGIIRTIRQQSVAEHSYYVTLYATYIAKRMDMSVEDIHWIATTAMGHDFEEMVSGDIPAPYKVATNIDRNSKIMSAPEAMAKSIMSTCPPGKLGIRQTIIKVADIFEAVMFLADEYEMGNHTVTALFHKLRSEMMNHGKSLPSDLMREINEYCNRASRTRILTNTGLGE